MLFFMWLIVSYSISSFLVAIGEYVVMLLIWLGFFSMNYKRSFFENLISIYYHHLLMQTVYSRYLAKIVQK